MRLFPVNISRRERREMGVAILFASPWIIGCLFLFAFPILTSLYFSFTRYQIFDTPKWVGLDNYIKLICEDRLFWISLYNTAYYSIFAIPLGMIISLLIAILVNQKFPGETAFRAIFYLPSVISGVALSVVFVQIFGGQLGLMNRLLSYVGIVGPGWLSTPEWSKPAFILMSLWGIGGGMVINLAGLQSIPREMYEVASIDGASVLVQFFRITLPLLSPTIFFNLIMSTISSFQIFITAYVMTNGGPVDSTLFYALYLYRQAFQHFQMGSASAMAWILFLVILVLTFVQFKFASRWVYYEFIR